MKRKYEIAVVSRGAFARTLRIYAPKKADRAIIMHDGQNVFRDEDAAYKKSWRAIDVLKSENIKNTAIIGIDCAATRDDDYLPFPSELEEYGVAACGGKADVYADYIEQKIIPYLDKRFGFRFYGMLGSSFGGQATLYIATRKNERIKAYGMYSTPLFFNAKAFGKYLETASFDADCFYHVYTGGNEMVGRIQDENLLKLASQCFVDDSFKIVNELRKSNVADIKLDVVNQAGHDETYWRTPEAFFFKRFSQF
ncbi:MAG: hypothetical protein J1G01_06055 [Clostridiales bacterium]|nr:hypothetical protein [Clostridiales bacterium]